MPGLSHGRMAALLFFQVFLWCVVASTLAACGASASLKSGFKVNVSTEEQLDTLIKNLDCSKCMHRKSFGFDEKPEDVEANCRRLPDSPLVVLAAKASEEKVYFDCVEFEPFFLPECYAYSRVRFGEKISLRDDAAFNETDVFRAAYVVEGDKGVKNGIQILPGHFYLIFSRRDEPLPSPRNQYLLSGTRFDALLNTRYELQAACDLDLQPVLPGLLKLPYVRANQPK